jgi:hypothetical protein|tara:strand:+ start:903 stop:1868 length:966 start_codon:yes stop_codon:yes gene_type:complete
MKYLIILLTYISISIAADGKIGGVTYFDYTNSKEKSAFVLKRQYFSYGIDISDEVKFRVVFDVGRTDVGTVLRKDGGEKSEDTRLVAFLKKAQIDHRTSYGKISMGLIGMNTYNIQEKNWGYRFIEKSAIDKYKFSSTADLGIGFSRVLVNQLKMSLQVVNGEGYKNPQSDKYHKIAFNSTYGEHNLVKNSGFNAGVVYTTEQTDDKPNSMASLFGGFAGMGLRLGGQFNMLKKGGIESQIISVSSNYSMTDKLDAFVRYDMFDPNTDEIDGWKDNSTYLIAGIQLSCGNGLLVAPNIRMESYEDDLDSATEYKINFQFKF